MVHRFTFSAKEKTLTNNQRTPKENYRTPCANLDLNQDRLTSNHAPSYTTGAYLINQDTIILPNVLPLNYLPQWWGEKDLNLQLLVPAE